MLAATRTIPTLEEEVLPHKIGSRTESAALLSWFLQNVWRMEPEDIDSAICDGRGDKGIDGLVLDEDLAEITLFQCKWVDDPSKKSQGDKDLKNLVGSAGFFDSGESVQALLDAQPNVELTKLLVRLEVKTKLEAGSHEVRLVFVTNAGLDPAGTDYAAARTGQEPALEVWSRDRLARVAESTKRAELRPETVKLIATARPTESQLTKSERIAVALVPASELVKLPGLDDHTLFSRNVRLFVGSTRINRDLEDSVRRTEEHSLFPAFHNGLTLLTEGLSVRGKTLTLTKVGVVNGCQSLTTLYDNKAVITKGLQLLVKVVEVDAHSNVADQITQRSNNQNAVTMRDQRASDFAMRDLQRNVTKVFGSKFALSIRAGEASTATVVFDNALAAQLITAVYLKEPWSAVRKVRLFDQDYRRIFNRSISPHKLRLLQLVDYAIQNARAGLREDLKASFASIRFALAHLVAEVCQLSEEGRALFAEPERWLPGQEAAVLNQLQDIAVEVVDSVNFYVESELDTNADLDPKVLFKSKSGVQQLENDVLRHAKREAKRSSYLFDVAPARTSTGAAARKRSLKKPVTSKVKPPNRNRP